jgi:hypothetical protein
MALILNLLVVLSLVGSPASAAEPRMVVVPQSIPLLDMPPLQPAFPPTGGTLRSPSDESGATQQPVIPEQRGTEGNPVIVKVLPADKTVAELSQEQQDRAEKSSSDRWMVRLTAVLAVGAVLQFLVLVGQAIVFGTQAKRLRQSVDLTREVAGRQERDMHASIAEASRAATAMEGVAAGISASVANTRELFATQRQFSQMQLRPYLSVTEPGFIPQNPERNLFAGMQVNVVNTGHTPAHNFRVASRVGILPFPLPDDIDLTIPDHEIISSGHINPGQRFFFRRNLDRLMSDDELQDIIAGNHRRIYIYGTVYCIDAFGNEHFTNFCQFGVWAVEGNFLGAINTPRHNDAT